MRKEEFRLVYEVYASAGELSREDAQLLDEARAAIQKAHAPYSHFKVGAAARLTNGQVISGANQENAAFPAGLCAEGVVLATASSLSPGTPIDTLAVSYLNENGPSDHPISPCGICRQSLQEFEQKTGRPIRLILGGMTGEIYIVSQANQLLPLVFGSSDLR